MFQVVIPSHKILHYILCNNPPLCLQQRADAAKQKDTLRDKAVKVAEAELKVQQLDNLRTPYDEYQKLVNELIPGAEKVLDQLSNESAGLNEAYNDVCVQLLTCT